MAFCRNCGNQLSEGASFCPNCGQPINNSENSQQSVNVSFVEKPVEETMKTWQKIVSILFWPAGVILIIASLIKKQNSIAKEASIYTLIGFVLALLLRFVL